MSVYLHWMANPIIIRKLTMHASVEREVNILFIHSSHTISVHLLKQFLSYSTLPSCVPSQHSPFTFSTFICLSVPSVLHVCTTYLLMVVTSQSGECPKLHNEGGTTCSTCHSGGTPKRRLTVLLMADQLGS